MQFLHWLYDSPLPIVAVVIVSPLVGLSMCGTLILRRVIPVAWRDSKDGIAACASAVGVIYAVLLGMIAVAVWDDYRDLEGKVAEEASLANNLFRDAEGFPEQSRKELRRLYRTYVGEVYCKEWPGLQRGTLDTANPPSRDTVNEVMQLASAFKPRDLGEANIHQETLAVVNRLLGMRRVRLLSADAHLLPVLWAVVIAGGFITIALTWLCHVPSKILSVLLNGVYALVVGLMVFCIFTLDHPFWGRVSVDAGPFAYVGRSINHLDTKLSVKDCLSE
jgi:hypothetical protein